MSMTEKSAYLCGILEGLSLDETKPEYKIISKLVDIIDDMAAEIEDLKEEIDTLGDYIEEFRDDPSCIQLREIKVIFSLSKTPKVNILILFAGLFH